MKYFLFTKGSKQFPTEVVRNHKNKNRAYYKNHLLKKHEREKNKILKALENAFWKCLQHLKKE